MGAHRQRSPDHDPADRSLPLPPSGLVMPRTRRQRQAPARSLVPVPPDLPQVTVSVFAQGTMSVSVDGTAYGPPPFAPPWRREDFAHVLDHVLERHRCPMRIEVREADGSVFTDIITPGRRRPAEPEPPTTASEPEGFLSLHGESFVPGEDVAIAVVVAHGEAAPDGTARALLTAEQLAGSSGGEVVLLGRVSGQFAIGRPT